MEEFMTVIGLLAITAPILIALKPEPPKDDVVYRKVGRKWVKEWL